ncbi:MAG: hypothetical protein A2W25_17445 [candidate division Zixibacteria bacterium RBG_16_53_22]|nr:MAG: hypothetical protein A2W25_17445 [candidate division Zixibacteria bacterium RBG_16_53_22]
MTKENITILACILFELLLSTHGQGQINPPSPAVPQRLPQKILPPQKPSITYFEVEPSTLLEVSILSCEAYSPSAPVYPVFQQNAEGKKVVRFRGQFGTNYGEDFAFVLDSPEAEKMLDMLIAAKLNGKGVSIHCLGNQTGKMAHPAEAVGLEFKLPKRGQIVVNKLVLGISIQ